MIKKIVSLFIISSIVCGAFVFDNVEANSSGLDENCYQVLLEEVKKVPGADSFTTLAPKNFQEINFVFQDSKGSKDPTLTGITFLENVFLTSIFLFGQDLGLKRVEAYPVSLANLLSEDQADKANLGLTNYEIFSVKGIDQSPIYCSAVIRFPKTTLTKEDFGSPGSRKIIASARRNYQDADFKTAIIEFDTYNRNFTAPIMTSYWVTVIPESDRTDFNPYDLHSEIISTINSFNEKYLPRAYEILSQPYESEKSRGDDSVFELVTEQSVYGMKLRLENKNPANVHNYDTWLDYYLAKAMLEQGQTLATEIWFRTRMPMEFLSQIGDTLERNKSIFDVDWTAMQQDDFSLKSSDMLDNLMGTAIDYARESGDPEPNKSTDVQLFWRIKQLVEKGATEKELQDYIAAYPSYLGVIADANRKMKAMEAMEEIKDVDRGAWYMNFIYELLGWGAMSADNDGNFHPGNLVNRAELAKIITVIFELDLPYKVESAPFPDVPADSWFAPFVVAAKKAGIVEGYPDGKFRPEQTVNRAEAMKMLSLAAGTSVPETATTEFPDVPKTAWFAKFVNFARAKEIVEGYSDGRFMPEQSINRAEIAKMATNAKKKFDKK